MRPKVEVEESEQPQLSIMPSGEIEQTHDHCLLNVSECKPTVINVTRVIPQAKTMREKNYDCVSNNRVFIHLNSKRT